MSNWSVNLETEDYIQDRDLIVKDAISAVQETKVGNFVNIVTAENHGDPISYLIPVLQETFGDTVNIKFIDQCGCGGYVYRVHRLAN